MKAHITKIKGISYRLDGSATSITGIVVSNPENSNTISDEQILSSLLPNANSLGGPLIFLGMSTFRFYEYLNTSSTNTETLAVNFSLKTIVLIMYTI